MANECSLFLSTIEPACWWVSRSWTVIFWIMFYKRLGPEQYWNIVITFDPPLPSEDCICCHVTRTHPPIIRLLSGTVLQTLSNVRLLPFFFLPRFFCSASSCDLISRRGVFSRRHYGSVEMVSDLVLNKIQAYLPLLVEWFTTCRRGALCRSGCSEWRKYL